MAVGSRNTSRRAPTPAARSAQARASWISAVAAIPRGVRCPSDDECEAVDANSSRARVIAHSLDRAHRLRRCGARGALAERGVAQPGELGRGYADGCYQKRRINVTRLNQHEIQSEKNEKCGVFFSGFVNGRFSRRHRSKLTTRSSNQVRRRAVRLCPFRLSGTRRRRGERRCPPPRRPRTRRRYRNACAWPESPASPPSAPARTPSCPCAPCAWGRCCCR